jgi:ADP-heptose:LPS heptosyltransferase
MIELPQVTVIIADTKNYGRAAYAIVKTLEQITPAKVVWLTDIDYDHPSVEVIKIPPIKDKADYSRIMTKDLTKYFQTPYCLTIQHDGYCIHGEAWNDEFYNWDFIGAPWVYSDPERNMGNDGFGLKSKRLCDILANDPFIEIVEPCDEILGRLYRRYLEQKYDIKYAPEELADTFSYELRTPICKTLGFHGYFHTPYQETVMITREGACGDVISLEPVLHYYHKKGYRVVLNTLPQFFSLFQSNYFKLHHPSELDGRLKYREINLDLSYEAKPKQLHLKSYFEACGIPESEMEIRAPKLNYEATEDIKFFKQKYVVVHIDRRETRNRDAETAWWKITDYLKSKGYLCVQVGKNEHVELDAIQLNTVAEPMLAYVISGCDLFIGIDSAPSHIAVATGRKSIIFFGSVDPEYIHPDLTNVRVITNHNKETPLCSSPYCWHSVSSTRGPDCIEDIEQPPCISYKSESVINAINELL